MAKKYHFLPIFLGYMTLFFSASLDNARGALFPVWLNEFEMNSQVGGQVFTVAAIVSLIVSGAARFWLPKFKAWKTTRFTLAVLIVSAILTGITFFNPTTTLLFLSSGVLGISMGIITITGNLLVTDFSEKQLHRQLLSGLHMMYSLSSLIAPLIIGLLIDFKQHWQIFYIIVLTLLIVTFLITSKKDYSEAEHEHKEENARPVSLMVKAIVSSGLALYVSAEVLISSRLTFLLTSDFDLAPGKASYYLSIFFVSLLLGRLLFSIIKANLPYYTLLTASMVLSLLFIFLGFNTSPLFFSLTGFTLSIFYPFYVSWISHLYPNDFPQLMSSMAFWVGVSLSVMHFGVSWMSEQHGISAVYQIPAVALLIAVAGVLVFLKVKTKA